MITECIFNNVTQYVCFVAWKTPKGVKIISLGQLELSCTPPVLRSAANTIGCEYDRLRMEVWSLFWSVAKEVSDMPSQCHGSAFHTSSILDSKHSIRELALLSHKRYAEVGLTVLPALIRKVLI